MEWVALALLAALVLGGAAAALGSGAESDQGLGRAVAKRIAAAPRALGAADAAAPVRRDPAARRAPSLPAAPLSKTRTPRTRAVDAFRRLRGVTSIARRAWIVCLGYRRWRYELAHPLPPTQALPLRDALAIANECLNPYAFLLEG